MSKQIKNSLLYVLIFILFFLTIYYAIKNHFKQYDVISYILVILFCLPFFINFENKVPTARELVLIAILTAVVVISRIVFSILPSFKPVSALIIIVGLSLRKEVGFMVGALAALLSNMYFGQGAWTPFQMLGWGVIGLLSGLVSNWKLMNRPIPIAIFGIVCGILYSMILDIQTMLFIDGTVNILRYLAIIITSIPTTAIYMVSNFIFLLLFYSTVFRILKRIKIKYGFFK